MEALEVLRYNEIREGLLKAVHAGSVDEVKRLIDDGASPNERGAFGRPILVKACAMDDLALARLLLDAGGNPNLWDCCGWTPLQFNARNGRVAAVKLLLSYGANPNTSVQGWTPLHSAVELGSVELAELLLEAGADINIMAPCLDINALPYGDDDEDEDEEGYTPLRMAQALGNQELTALLSKANSKR